MVVTEQDTSKIEALKRRVDAEKDLNEKRIVKFMGNYVTIGEEVLISHLYS